MIISLIFILSLSSSSSFNLLHFINQQKLPFRDINIHSSQDLFDKKRLCSEQSPEKMSFQIEPSDKSIEQKTSKARPSFQVNMVLDPEYTGRNGHLKEWMFTEPSFHFPYSGTIDEFVQNQRFKAGDLWWLSPGSVANISSENSRSPLKLLYGGDAFREIYWPNDGYNGADLSKFRIALNCVGKPTDYEEKSIEIFFRNPKTGKPEPFLYAYNRQKNGEWIPVKELFGMPVEEFCIKCHRNKEGQILAFPKLIFHNLKGISRSGYYSEFWEQLVSNESYWETM